MKISKIIYSLFFLSLLSIGFNIVDVAPVEIRLWYLPVLLLGFMFFQSGKFSYNKYVAYIFLFLILSTLASNIISGFDHNYFINSLIQSFVFIIFLLILLSVVNHLGIEKSVQAYLLASTVFAVTVIFHEGLYFFDSTIAANVFGPARTSGVLLKAKGILGEPSWGGVLLAPSTYIALMLHHKKRFFLLFIASILTISVLTYISLILSLLLYFLFVGKNQVILKIFAAIVLTSLIIGLANQPIIKSRINQAYIGMDIIANKDTSIENYSKAAGTIGTLVFNFTVALEAAKKTFGVGVGFGNNRFIYSELFDLLVPAGYSGEGLFYSKQGGGSLWIRIFSELGLVGLFFMIYAHYKIFSLHGKMIILYKNKSISKNTLIGFSLGLIIFVVYCIRKDAWINVAFIFSLSILFIAHKASKNSIKIHMMRL